MSERWSLRYWTKAECCGEPVNLVGPIVLLTNFTSDHISSALGKSPSCNGSAALAGSTRRSASADSEAPDPTTNLRREIAIVSEALANHRQCVRCNALGNYLLHAALRSGFAVSRASPSLCG